MNEIKAEDFDKAVLQAPADRPVLVYVTATWCGPCRALRPIVEAFDAENKDRVNVVKVDANECRAMLASINVASVPTLIAYKGGVETGRVVGGNGVSKEKIATLVGITT